MNRKSMMRWLLTAGVCLTLAGCGKAAETKPGVEPAVLRETSAEESAGKAGEAGQSGNAGESGNRSAEESRSQEAQSTAGGEALTLPELEKPEGAYQKAAYFADLAYAYRKGNTLVSPVSLNIALGLAMEGASGETEKELQDYLGQEDYGDWVDRYLHYLEGLTVEQTEKPKQDDDELIWVSGGRSYSFRYEIANSIWVKKGEKLQKEYQELVQEKYRAAAENVDFMGEADKTAKKINQWCSDRTHGLITQVVDPKMFTESMRAILVNSLYFESPWVDEWGLTEHSFRSLSGEETTQEMLCDTVKTYYENDKATAFAKPYYNGFTFIGILPKQEGEFMISDLDLESLMASETTKYDVNVIAPKLNYESTTDQLVEILQSQGVERSFTDNAEFDKMIEGRTLHISKIIQKCKIELDEKGTKAAAVTAMMMCDNAILIEENEVKEVNLDRPYAFMIYDTVNKQILFVGKVTEL